MKKLTMGVMLLTAMTFASNANLQKIQSLPIIQQAKIKVQKAQEVDGMFQIRGLTMPMKAGQKEQPVEFFLTANYKYLIMGKGINAENGQPIRFKTDMSKIEGKEAFSYGTGKKELYVFTDPECPYCKTFEKKMAELKDKYIFRVFLFPLSFHKNAVPMSKYIMSAKTDNEKFERMLGIANGSIEYQNFKMSQKESQDLEEIIEAQLELGREAEITGTPTIMNSNGDLVDWSKL